MPRVMRQLAVVQFLSWFALFAMWIYTTAAVTTHHYGTTDATSAVFNEGANWVGVLFAAYNGFAALAALFIPPLAARLGPATRASRGTVVRRHSVSCPYVSSTTRHGCCCRWLASASRGHRSCHCRTRCCPGSARPEDGHLHGHLQLLHRDPADPGGERARHPACACCSTAQASTHWRSAGSCCSWRGWRRCASTSRTDFSAGCCRRMPARSSRGWISTDSTSPPATSRIRLSTSDSAARACPAARS